MVNLASHKPLMKSLFRSYRPPPLSVAVKSGPGIFIPGIDVFALMVAPEIGLPSRLFNVISSEFELDFGGDGDMDTVNSNPSGVCLTDQ